MNAELSIEQCAELKRLKQYFPYRIVFGAINPTTKEFQAYAMHNKRKINDLNRKGFAVFMLS